MIICRYYGGPGLVIYWFGHVESLNAPALEEPPALVMPRFPLQEEIERLDSGGSGDDNFGIAAELHVVDDVGARLPTSTAFVD